MENFDYSLKTNILFGRDRILELKDIIESFGKNVLLVYGGKSIKKMGLYKQICDLLTDFNIFEVANVQPNPRIDSVYQGIEICKENKIDVVLAVGGGSAMDCAKAIAVGAKYSGDIWKLIKEQISISDALPLVGVVTISASGSELAMGAVISNPETNEKIGFDSPWMQFNTVIMDPSYTTSVPKKHTAAGVIDIFSHLLEQYLTSNDTYLSNLLCESVMKTVIHYGPIAYQDPNNYEARAQLMWASSLANNGILSLGNQIYAFSVHGIEHELSAYYDIIHGIGLAIVTPNWMRYILNDQTVKKLARYGREIWQIQDLDDYQTANQAIDMTAKFFYDLNVPIKLSELKIDEHHFDQMAKQAVKNGFLQYAWKPLDENDVKQILKMCL